MVQTFVAGLHPGSLEGILNAIRFVVPIGGGLAFDALTACRNVQSAPHVVPPVSAVDLTVKVIAGVGVGVGVTSGESVTVWYVAPAGLAAHRFCPKPTSARETPARHNTNPIKTRRSKKADCVQGGVFFIGSFSRCLPFASLLPEIRDEVPEIFQDN
jgi:hypothetical protein